ncbi:MAG: hypothetical protein UT94_C0024G0012 [Candidatus Uhrbacteria bacterium GW2011_GWF2_40_263]|nr:MAG: hypothetical protein UT94_C0024G0012 [Candidatus Uhrbacteria bacterium GW2011_GWF2_40_263]
MNDFWNFIVAVCASIAIIILGVNSIVKYMAKMECDRFMTETGYETNFVE